MAKFIMSAFADEYSSALDVQLKMLKENGIGYIEPRFIDSKNISALDISEVSELKKKLDDAEIKVSSIGSPIGKISLADDFNKHLELARRTFETANVLETKNVRMFSFYLHKEKTATQCREEVIEKLGCLIDLADSFNVTLCHENEAEIYGESPNACLDLLKTFGGKLKCVFDMGNFVLGGYRPYPDAYELLYDYIEYFHIKDALYKGAIVPPGCGEASVKDILDSFIKTAEKDIIVTLEPHLEVFDGLNRLAVKTFENPYVFDSKEEAFLTAVRNLKEIIS